MSSCHGCSHHYYPAPTYKQVVSEIKIIHTEDAPEKSFWAEGTIDFVQIDEKVVIELPSVSKAIQCWERFQASCARWKMGVTIVGILGSAWGTWRSIEKRSAHWTVGTALFALGAYYWRFQLNQKINRSEWARAELNTMVDEEGKPVSVELCFKPFRENLLRDGLEKFEEHRNIPPAYPQELLALFTQEELKGLLNRWVEHLKTLSTVERGQLLQTHDLFVTAFPTESPHREAAQLCNHVIRCVMNARMKENVWIFNTHLVRQVKEVVKKCLGDHPQFKSLFEERFAKELQNFECTDEMIQEGIGKFFETKLSLFADDPEQFTLDMRCNTKEQADRILREFSGIICTKHLRDVFARIFSMDGVENYRQYLDWVFDQFVKIPDDYSNKQFLLSLVPEN